MRGLPFSDLMKILEKGELQDLWTEYTQQLKRSRYAVLPNLEQVAAMLVLSFGWSDEHDLQPLTIALASYCGLTPDELEARRASFELLAELFMDVIDPGCNAFDPVLVFAVEDPTVLFSEDEPFVYKDPKAFVFRHWED